MFYEKKFSGVKYLIRVNKILIKVKRKKLRRNSSETKVENKAEAKRRKIIFEG